MFKKIKRYLSKPLTIGDEIEVYIMDKYHGTGNIVADYNKDQWIVDFKMVYPNGYIMKTRRYINKNE